MLSPFMMLASEDVANHRDHFCAVQLDGAQASTDRLRARCIDEVEPANTERLDGLCHFAGDCFWRANVKRALLDFSFVLVLAYRRPASQCTDAITEDAVVRPVQFAGFLVSIGDEAWRVHPDRMSGRAELRGGTLVEFDVGGEACGVSSNNGEHERKPVARCADDRLRCTADPHPGGQVSGLSLGEDIGVLEWCTHGATPRDRLL